MFRWSAQNCQRIPSDIVRLSGEKMEENDQNIRYLLGQLKTIHLPDVKAITLQEGFLPV